MQTSIVKQGYAIAVAGQVSDNWPLNAFVSRISQEASTRIQFGVGVKAGAKLHGVLLPTVQASIIQGIVAWNRDHVPGASGDLDQASTPPGLKPLSGMQVMRQGHIWVVVDPGVVSVVVGEDRGWCRAVASGGNTTVGAWSNAQDSTNNVDCTKQVVFISQVQTAADGVTKIAEVECCFTIKP